MKIQYLSASRLQTWLQCPQKFKLHYIDKVPWEFKPVALVFGTAFHAALEHYYLGLKDGNIHPVVELIDVFNKHWKKDTENVNLDTDDPESVASQAEPLLETFHQDVVPGNIIDVEWDFRVPIINDTTGEILDVDLVGRVDLIEADNTGVPVIVDHKTLSRRPTEKDYDHNIQLMAYSYATRSEKIIPEGDDLLLRIDALIKTKAPSFHQIHIVHTLEATSRFFELAKGVLAGIEADVYPPNPGWYCQGCPVQKFCCLHS